MSTYINIMRWDYSPTPGGATAIERWTPCSFKKTRKKGRFSRTGDVRAYSGKGIKIAEIWKKRVYFSKASNAFRVYILLIMKIHIISIRV